MGRKYVEVVSDIVFNTTAATRRRLVAGTTCGFSETSAINYQPRPCNVEEQRRPQLHRCRSLKCHTCASSNDSSYGKGKATPLREVKAPRFEDNRHMKVQACQPYPPAIFTPRKYSWYSFLLEAESTPGPQCGRKDYVNEKFQWHYRESNPPPSGL